MRKLRIIALIAGLLFSLTARAQNKQIPGGNKIEPLPRDLEIQLALSALPRHLRDSATVYVLNPDKGFEVARKGTNAQMRVFFDAAEMQAKGTPPEKLKEIVQDRYKANYYKAPERTGVSYMLSPILRTYVNPDANDLVATAIVPHVMHYAPNVSNEEVGGANPSREELRYFSEHGQWLDSPSPFVILHGPHGYFIQFLGVTERAAIDKEYEGMLAQLCKIKDQWCLPTPKGQ